MIGEFENIKKTTGYPRKNITPISGIKTLILSGQDFTFASGSTKGIFKLDWNINDNNRLAIIYNWLNASKEKPAHPTALGFRGPNAATLQFQNTGYEINNKLQSIQLELNSTLSESATKLTVSPGAGTDNGFLKSSKCVYPN